MTARPGPAVGELAPDFILPSVGGGNVALRDLRGSPLWLIFLRWLG